MRLLFTSNPIKSISNLMISLVVEPRKEFHLLLMVPVVQSPKQTFKE